MREWQKPETDKLSWVPALKYWKEPVKSQIKMEILGSDQGREVRQNGFSHQYVISYLR